MIKLKHENDVEYCLKCEEKLRQAHPTLVSWFYYIKSLNPEAHISWSFRNEEDQNNMVKYGKSKAMWPTSEHNTLDENGNPCSRALDLFRLDENGRAAFEKEFYLKIKEETLQANLPISFGADFMKISDWDHFQIKGDIKNG